MITYEAGDILICKKDYCVKGYKIAEVGKYYKIVVYEFNGHFDVFCVDFDIPKELSGTSLGIFIIHPNGAPRIAATSPHLYDYFYDKQEVRKLKLKKIETTV